LAFNGAEGDKRLIGGGVVVGVVDAVVFVVPAAALDPLEGAAEVTLAAAVAFARAIAGTAVCCALATAGRPARRAAPIAIFMRLLP
jgi:hypothetical protein